MKIAVPYLGCQEAKGKVLVFQAEMSNKKLNLRLIGKQYQQQNQKVCKRFYPACSTAKV